MASTRATGVGAWRASNSSVRLSASIPGLEDDPKWRPTAGCSSPSSNEQSSKDVLPSSSTFSRSIPDEGWYANPLMDEMKDLSYASSLASQQATTVSASHFDSTHLQSFLSSNNSSSFNSLHNRTNLSNLLDGGERLPLDGGGSSVLMNNFSRLTGAPGSLGGNLLVEPQNGNDNNNTLGSLLPDLGQILRNNVIGNCSSISLGDGGRFNPHTLGGNLSSILHSGRNDNFTSYGGGSLANKSPFSSSYDLDASSAAKGNVSVFDRDGFNDTLNFSSKDLHWGNKDSAQPSNMERSLLHSRMMLNTLERATTASSTGSQQPQTSLQKRVASLQSISGEAVSSTIKSRPQVGTSASNESSVDMPDEECPNIKGNSKGSTILPTSSSLNDNKRSFEPVGSDDVGEFGIDGEEQLDQDDGNEEDDMDDSGDGSRAQFEADDAGGMEGSAADGQGLVQGGQGEKGKGRKGLPAKNLMAERRRRKKLNDRLYMLRSVVPKITKMDRASILGDAIDYLKELVQQVNDLHTELETASVERPLPPSPPALLPTAPNLPCRVKEEPMSSLPNPDPQPARVEVRTREGKAVNIQMFCQRRPGLLLSTMRALDGLGLDVQQAVVSCFNGFALDVFKAEQSKGTDVGPEDIRAALLQTAASHNI